MRKCIKCETTKADIDFSGKRNTCKSCSSEYCKQYRRDRPGYRHNIYVRHGQTLAGHSAMLILQLRRRSKKAGLAMTVEARHLVELFVAQDGLCALSGLPMSLIKGHGRIATNVSVDRIRPSLGYVPGNVRLVCLRANEMRQDGDDAALLAWAGSIVRHLGRVPREVRVA